jgi:23S rRNA-/tRNA-specific pseudouridylate synthase
MTRQYVAFVQGKLSIAQGTWRHWLQLSQDERRQQVVPAPGGTSSGARIQEAITHFEVIRKYCLPGMGTFAKVRLKLETGCRHQIRVQAAQAGLPLIGDRTYNPNWRGSGLANGGIRLWRQALHAEALELEHPDYPGERMRWTAPWPKDLGELESRLESGQGGRARA